MKLLFSKQNLAEGVNIAKKAVAQRTTMPILECIYIRADKEIKFIGSNLETEIKAVVAGEIFEPGDFAVNASVFSSIVGKLPDTDIYLELIDDKCVITCEKKKYEIPVVAGEFNLLPEITGKKINVLADDVKKAIDDTVFAVSDENVMSALRFGKDERVVGLNGHCIASRKLAPFEEDILVKGDTAKKIAGLFKGGNVTITYNEKQIKFESDNFVASALLLSGKFPDISQVEAVQATTSITVDREKLSNSLDLFKLLVKETDRKPIIFDIKNDSLVLSVNTFIGAGTETLDIHKEGNDLKIAFNPHFLSQIISVIDDDEITLELSGATSPCMIKNDNYKYILMPVNIYG